MPASVYSAQIRELPVGSDLLPYLVFSGYYHDVLRWLSHLSREERHCLVVYIYEPAFTDAG